jgi:predicted metal-dependent enzyme (double-stranded beta helix superfamily)
VNVSVRSDFDLERFIGDCESAGDEVLRVRELVAHAVSNPAALLQRFGVPRRGAMTSLHRSAAMTVMHLVWGPQMSVLPHDHRMWAVIGVYAGREDNTTWRRTLSGALQQSGTSSLAEGQVLCLGRDVIHSVVNPLASCTAAIHVYGGDFFATERSEWDDQGRDEHRFDVAHAMARFGAGSR